MDNLAEIRSLLTRGAKIKIIGDSLAAGAGSSSCIKTNHVFFVDEYHKEYVLRVAPNSWWGRFETYLHEKLPECSVVNHGCGGIFSSQIRSGLNQLYHADDDIVMILLGANDRKIEEGMIQLYDNLISITTQIKAQGKQVILLTPNPSAAKNESYYNRIYHLDDVSDVISQVAIHENVLLVNNFNYIQEYLFLTNQTIEDMDI